MSDYYSNVSDYEKKLVCDFDYDNSICNTGDDCDTRGNCASYAIIPNYCIENKIYTPPVNLVHFKQIKDVEVRDCFKVGKDTGCSVVHDGINKQCLFMLKDADKDYPLL